MSNHNEQLVSYFLLCSAANGGKAHPVNAARDVFTKKELSVFFREHQGVLTAHEHVIGGAEEQGDDVTTV